MANPIVRFFANQLLERPGKRLGADALVERLDAGGGVIAALAEAAAPSGAPLEASDAERAAALDASARKQLRHVIAIERWGQRRLQAALGDVAYERDESRAYAPPEDEPLAALVERFRAVRAETVALGRRVAAEGKGGVAVEHNSLGPISALAWLRYLQVHGELEMRRVRAAKPKR